VAKDVFIEINLQLIATHAVIGSDQPLLEVANSTVCERDDGFGAFPEVDSQGLATRHVPKSSFLQSGKTFEAVSVYGRTWRYVLEKR
jgi:hypothetical protein